MSEQQLYRSVCKVYVCLYFVCIYRRVCMPDDVSSLLHMYRLRARQTQRLPARSDLHEGAHVRMRPEDVAALALPADSLRPMLALFSTAAAAEAICLRTA
jgi:hypothetical protein